MSSIGNIIETACADLRGDYAKNVVRGGQRWSGADLRGKAKKFGGSYARQRTLARVALHKAGGTIVALRRTGLRITAVKMCVDDFGTAVYDTTEGILLATQLR